MDGSTTAELKSYFCTVGKGLEHFCKLELKALETFGTVTISDVIVGKVFFLSNLQPKKLLSLKTVERLFILVSHSKQFLCNTARKAALNNLKVFLNSSDIDLEKCLDHWMSFKCFFHSNLQPNVENPSLGGCSFDDKVCIRRRRNIASSEFLEIDESPLKKTRASDDKESACKPTITFRISCKCSGMVKKNFSTNLLSVIIGQSISQSLNWKVELRKPDIEVYVHANNEHLTIGFPITQKPLSQRCYIKHIMLRSTICYAMLMSVGGFDPHSILLDPMCGAATLLVEAATSFPNITLIGIDIDNTQLKYAQENIASANVKRNVLLLQSNACSLPLKHETVSYIVCDLPFGLKFGSTESVKKLLPSVLLEMDKVLVPKGKIVLLITDTLTEYLFHCISNLKQTLPVENISSNEIFPQKKVITEASSENYNIVPLSPIEFDKSCHWQKLECHFVKLGELPASICVFQKA